MTSWDIDVLVDHSDHVVLKLHSGEGIGPSYPVGQQLFLEPYDLEGVYDLEPIVELFSRGSLIVGVGRLFVTKSYKNKESMGFETPIIKLKNSIQNFSVKPLKAVDDSTVEEESRPWLLSNFPVEI